MKILNLNVMRGPNYWSNYRKNLIIMKLDLGEYQEVLTSEINYFNDDLKSLLPTLHQHRCSVGVEGGFLSRLEEGTLLGHVIEHVALELQTLAGMDCGYGRVRESSQRGIYHVVFSYQIEKAGIYAAKAAFDIVKTLIRGDKYRYLESDIEELKYIRDTKGFGPSTDAILKEAYSRDIPYVQLNESLVMLGQGQNQKLLLATTGHQTSCIGVDMVGNKNFTKKLLAKEYIPVPEGSIVDSLDSLTEEVQYLGFPLVIKPCYGHHGEGITTNINSMEEAIKGYDHAKRISKSIIVEKYINGFDYRFLVINYKVVAVAKRTPAHVVGNGKKTIQELINEVNSDPKRGQLHENVLTKIKIDETTRSILSEQGLTLDSILPNNEIVFLKGTANISTGGTAVDVTDEVHPENIFLAERIARLTNLDVCGIDIIAKNITYPIRGGGGAVLEVNAAPGFRMHLSPSSGVKRNVAKPFIDLLYPNQQPARIPLVAVTGTNGKTTVVRLIGHIANQLHYKVGMTTTEGIYINNQTVYTGDCSGPQSAATVLRDPLVNFAVLECARGGIIRSGLGFDKCSVSIVTNISEDHLGLGDIHSIEKLAKVKSVVPHSTLDNGYAILNAEDSLVYAMKKDLHCKVALFSTTKNENIIKHCAENNLACYIENDIIFIHDEGQHIKIININEIPLTMQGKSKAMKENVLPAILACWVNQFSLPDIIKGLISFIPNAENLPGRMNIFDFDHCRVMLDYAHNENAFIELKNYLSTIEATKKIGIIAGTGDRRDSDIQKVGFYASQMFDEIIIRHDLDSRGRTNEEITKLIVDEIRKHTPNKKIEIISNEFEALEFALANAIPGSFVWYFPDKVLEATSFLNGHRKNLENKLKVKIQLDPQLKFDQDLFVNINYRAKNTFA